MMSCCGGGHHQHHNNQSAETSNEGSINKVSLIFGAIALLSVLYYILK